MTSRTLTRWAIVAFIAIGLLVAVVLILRDLGDEDVPEETGTAPGLVRLSTFIVYVVCLASGALPASSSSSSLKTNHLPSSVSQPWWV